MADGPESFEQEYPYFDKLPLSDHLRIAVEVEGLVPARLVEALEEAVGGSWSCTQIDRRGIDGAYHVV